VAESEETYPHLLKSKGFTVVYRIHSPEQENYAGSKLFWEQKLSQAVNDKFGFSFNKDG
jgi:hypothetical protein